MDRSNQLLLKNHALHKLIPIVLQLTNQIKQKFSAKSCSARAIFLKLLWGRGWVAWKYSIHFKLRILQLIIDCSVGKKAANLFKRRLFWTDWDDCYRSQIPPLEKARTSGFTSGSWSWVSDLIFRVPSLAFKVPALRLSLGIGSLVLPKVPSSCPIFWICSFYSIYFVHLSYFL